MTLTSIDELQDTANSKPPLYLIIEKDPEEDTDETKKDFMDEMIEFASKYTQNISNVEYGFDIHEL